MVRHRSREAMVSSNVKIVTYKGRKYELIWGPGMTRKGKEQAKLGFIGKDHTVKGPDGWEVNTFWVDGDRVEGADAYRKAPAGRTYGHSQEADHGGGPPPGQSFNCSNCGAVVNKGPWAEDVNGEHKKVCGKCASLKPWERNYSQRRETQPQGGGGGIPYDDKAPF